MAVTKPGAELAIVVVSYNVRELLGRCLTSIAASARDSELACRIVVIDNASSDGSVDMLRRDFPAVEVVVSPHNLGFAAASNAVLRALLGSKVEGRRSKVRISETFDLDAHPLRGYPTSTFDQGQVPPHYILLLNPDTEVVGDALGRMVGFLERHPEVAVVGPQLRYGDGTLQSSRRRFPTRATLFWESTLLAQWWPGNPWVRRYRYRDYPVEQPTPAGWLVGAALMVRREAIERAGLLDERFWMYSEELEWQGRLARYGRVVYLPEAVVVHHEGKSSEQNMARRQLAFDRSKLRYAQLRWGRRVQEPLRLFLLLGYMIQLSLEAAKWLLGHKRQLRRRRIVDYVRVFGALARDAGDTLGFRDRADGRRT